MIHRLHHLSHIVFQLIKAGVFVARVVYLFHIIFTVLVLFIVAILFSGTFHGAGYVASKAYSRYHILGVVLSVSFRELVSHTLSHVLDCLHVVFHHDILRR